MGDFVFRTKSPNREVEIQIPIPGTGELDAMKRLIKGNKKNEIEEVAITGKKKKRKKNSSSGESKGALASMSALLASLIMIAMDD